MAHYVTCKFCKERFDRDKEPTVKISERRYAHKSCAEKQETLKTQDEKDLEELENYIKELLKINTINAKIRKQILEPKAWNTGQGDIDKDAPDAFNKVTRLSQHIAFFKDFFRAYKDFTDFQLDTIEILLMKLYARFGITCLLYTSRCV